MNNSSYSTDGNNDSEPPNTSGETCIPSTYPYNRDVYFIQGDVGASTHNPTSSPPPPPIGHTYYQSHSDFYPMPSVEPEDNYNIYEYGESSDSTTNYGYGYGYDIRSSESSYYNPYPSKTMPQPPPQP